MRVYFEKPRTTTGWKGMINDPHLDDSGRREHRPAHGARAAARGAGPGPAGGVRVPRPDHPAVHLRHRGLGRDRRPHHREPDPPPAGLGPVDAGRASRTAPTATCRWRWTPCARPRCRTRSPAWTSSGTPAILHTTRQPRLPRHPARRPRRPQLRRRRRWPTRWPKLRAAGLPERVVVDASHDNSGKDPERQPRGRGRDRGAGGRPATRAIVGVMLESFLVAGRQELGARRAARPTASRSPTPAWTGTPRSAVLDGLAAAVRGATARSADEDRRPRRRA